MNLFTYSWVKKELDTQKGFLTENTYSNNTEIGGNWFQDWFLENIGIKSRSIVIDIFNIHK